MNVWVSDQIHKSEPISAASLWQITDVKTTAWSSFMNLSCHTGKSQKYYDNLLWIMPSNSQGKMHSPSKRIVPHSLNCMIIKKNQKKAYTLHSNYLNLSVLVCMASHIYVMFP